MHSRLGLLYKHAGQYDLAVDHLTRALEYSADKSVIARAYHNLAGTYYYMGEFEEQEKNLRKSLALRQGDDRFLSLLDLGECLIRQERLSEARSVLKEALTYYESQPNNLDRIKLYKWLKVSAPSVENALMYADSIILETEAYTRRTLNVQGIQKKEALRTALAKYRKEEPSVVNDTFLSYFWKILLFLAVIIIALIIVIRKVIGRSDRFGRKEIQSN